jgi:RNA polymerase sigma-70 factor, ECF subfamily
MGRRRWKERRVAEVRQQEQFRQAVLPHLDAAYNLARWLLRQDQDAEDAVQEAYLNAWKSFHQFHGLDGRCWLLRIVRNACYTRLRRGDDHDAMTAEMESALEGDSPQPLAILVRQSDAQNVHQCLDQLPVGLREVLVLRELEGLSYKEISQATALPIGTVMSRLARGRQKLATLLSETTTEEVRQ